MIVALQNDNQQVLGVRGKKPLKLIKRNAVIACLDFGICNPPVFVPSCWYNLKYMNFLLLMKRYMGSLLGLLCEE